MQHLGIKTCVMILIGSFSELIYFQPKILNLWAEDSDSLQPSSMLSYT